MRALTGFCPECGRELSRAARYCPGCGAKITELSHRPAAPSGPQLTAVRPAAVAAPSVPGADRPPAVAAGPLGPAAAPPQPSQTAAVTGRDARPPQAAIPPILPQLVELRGDSRLAELDRWISAKLDLGFIGQPFQEPTILSETAREFYGMLLAGEALSEGQWHALLEQQLQEAREHARHGGGVWGAFLAGQGCFVNGWLFQSVFGLAAARDALNDPRTQGLLFGTVAHEKWGHGFLSAATALGAEVRQVHLDRLRFARLFSGLRVTTPEGVILREKWRAVYNATRFAEEGWATWVEQLVREGFGGPAGAPAAGMAQRLAGFAVPELRLGKLVSAQQALVTLFDARQRPEQAKAAMAALEQAEEELPPYFVAQYGRPPRYVVGHGLCWMIAQRFGERNVPVALLLAENVVFGLASQGVSDIVNVIATSPDMNVNGRLAAIAHLPIADAPGLSRREFARACHHRLGLSIPDSLKT